MKKLLMSTILLGAMLFAFAGMVSAGQVLVSENFDNVANGKLPAGWTATEGEWQVQDGQLIGFSADLNTLARVTFGDPSWTNYEISATVTWQWAKDAKRWASLMYRVQGEAGPPWSQFAFRQGTTAANGLEIAYRSDANKWTVWTKAPYKANFEMGEKHQMRVVVFGTQAWGFVDGEKVIELAEAVKELQGRVGVQSNGSTVAFDNVVVKSIDANDLKAMGLQ